jgi:hypothetical protein
MMEYWENIPKPVFRIIFLKPNMMFGKKRNMTERIPNHVLKSAHWTLYWAMVFCRNYTAGKNADIRLVYEMMDALHAIPEILNRWGGHNNVDTLRMYFGCFNHAKWRKPEDTPQPPDLVAVFNQKMDEFNKTEAEQESPGDAQKRA